MPKTLKGNLEIALVTEKADGIILTVSTEENERKGYFLPLGEKIGDINLILKPGMDARAELQKVCNLLNGYTVEDGKINPIPNFIPKKINIVIE